MTPEQEKTLVDVVERIDKFIGSFHVGLEKADLAESKPHRWYTPRGLFLRVMHAAALTGQPETAIACTFLYGTVAVLGFPGTFKLLLWIVRKRNARQNKKSAVPGVRSGGNDNPR